MLMTNSPKVPNVVEPGTCLKEISKPNGSTPAFLALKGTYQVMFEE